MTVVRLILASLTTCTFTELQFIKEGCKLVTLLVLRIFPGDVTITKCCVLVCGFKLISGDFTLVLILTNKDTCGV